MVPPWFVEGFGAAGDRSVAAGRPSDVLKGERRRRPFAASLRRPNIAALFRNGGRKDERRTRR